MRAILDERRPVSVHANLYSKTWLSWNFRMLAWTITLSGLGLFPYAYIIVHDISDRTFFSTWMYPMLRVLGSALSVTMIQLTIQLRIFGIIRHCLAVHAVSTLFKEEGRAPPLFWAIDMRSQDCLRKLRVDINSKLCLWAAKTQKSNHLGIQISSQTPHSFVILGKMSTTFTVPLTNGSSGLTHWVPSHPTGSKTNLRRWS